MFPVIIAAKVTAEFTYAPDILAIAEMSSTMASPWARAMATSRPPVGSAPTAAPLATTEPHPRKTKSSVAMNSADVTRHAYSETRSLFSAASTNRPLPVIPPMASASRWYNVMPDGL